MNGPVVPAASPDSPARSDRRRGARGRLALVLLAPVRAVAFFGLSLAGAVLLVAAIGPVVVGVTSLWHVIQDISGHGIGGQDEQDLLNVLIGLALCRFLLPTLLVAARRLASLTRRLAGRWCAVAIPEAYAPEPASAAPARGSSGALLDLMLRGHGRITYLQRMTWLVSDRATWRDLLWLAVSVVAGPVLLIAPIGLVVGGTAAFLAVNLNGFDRTSGAVLVAVGVAAAPWLLRAYVGLARLALAPSESSVLEQRVAYLALTRQESLDTGAAELRRIERDLHDGAQARLVAMGLTLDAAGRLIDTDPVAARSLLIEARDASAKALTELRDLVRGVHPPVLADRGLADAVRALALDSPARARVTGSLDGRAPAPVESAAYFAVSELLANVAKHAGAQSADVDLRHSLGALRITVRDDGDGGADPGRGTGLRGVERRIAAFDGVLAISSPVGGPTVITMEIPCELS
jgi:signal transduction histidine kinase